MAGLPAYTGITFTSTQHSDVPANLTPSQQSLPTPFVACITGASRGIGAAFAIAFAQAGATGLVITARKVESLDETKKQCLEAAKSKQLRVTCLAANASSDESVAENIAETIKKEHGRLDLLGKLKPRLERRTLSDLFISQQRRHFIHRQLCLR